MLKNILILIILNLGVVNISFAESSDMNFLEKIRINSALIKVGDKDISIVNKLLYRANSTKKWKDKNYNYLYKIKTTDNEKLGVFLITEIHNKNAKIVKSLEMKIGYTILIDGNASTKVVWKGNLDSIDTCKAPKYKNIFKISNPSCRERWNLYSYYAVSRILFTQSSIVRAKMDGVEYGHLVIEGILHAIELKMNPQEKIIGDITKSAISNDLQGTLSILGGGNKATSDLLADVMVDTLIEAGEGYVSPHQVVVSQSTKIIGIFNNLLGAFLLDDLTEEMNDLIIARKYLTEYYSFGSLNPNASVAEFHRIPRNSSLWDTIDKIAKDNGYSNHWYGTEYNIDRIQGIVENLKYHDIPEYTQTCLRGECL